MLLKSKADRILARDKLTYSESRRFKWASFIAITWSSRSRRQLSTQRSAIPFCPGLLKEVRTGIKPIDRIGDLQPIRTYSFWNKFQLQTL